MTCKNLERKEKDNYKYFKPYNVVLVLYKLLSISLNVLINLLMKNRNKNRLNSINTIKYSYPAPLGGLKVSTVMD